VARVSKELPLIYLARHGEANWALSGQRSGRSDLPLTARGEPNATRLADRLKGLTFEELFCSSLQRVRRTRELAGFGPVAAIDPDILEWEEVHATRPDWQLFRDGCPGGESPDDIATRADSVGSSCGTVA
jgi:broad specificity phosphatase PhoE